MKNIKCLKYLQFEYKFSKENVDWVNIFIPSFCKNRFLLWIFCLRFEWFTFHKIYLLIILFVECSFGTFGDGCQFKCHCYHNFQCIYVTGKCPNGLCAAGYKGDNCQEGEVFLFFRIKIMLR